MSAHGWKNVKYFTLAWPYSFALVNVGNRQDKFVVRVDPTPSKALQDTELKFDSWGVSDAIIGQHSMQIPVRDGAIDKFLEELYKDYATKPFITHTFVLGEIQSSLPGRIDVHIHFHLNKQLEKRLKARHSHSADASILLVYCMDVRYNFKTVDGMHIHLEDIQLSDRRAQNDVWLRAIEAGKFNYKDPKSAYDYDLVPKAVTKDPGKLSADTPIKEVPLQTARFASYSSSSHSVAPRGKTSATVWQQNPLWIEVRLYLAGLNSRCERIEGAIARLNGMRLDVLRPLSILRTLRGHARLCSKSAANWIIYLNSAPTTKLNPAEIAERRRNMEAWERKVGAIEILIDQLSDKYARATGLTGFAADTILVAELEAARLAAARIFDEFSAFVERPSNVKLIDDFWDDTKTPPTLKELVRIQQCTLNARMFAAAKKVAYEKLVEFVRPIVLDNAKTPSTLKSLSTANKSVKAVFKSLDALPNVPSILKTKVDVTALAGIEVLAGVHLVDAEGRSDFARTFGRFRTEYEQKYIDALALSSEKAQELKGHLSNVPKEIDLQNRGRTPSQRKASKLLYDALGDLSRVKNVLNIVEGVGSFFELAYCAEKIADADPTDIDGFLINGAKGLSAGIKSGAYILQMAGDIPLALRLDRLAVVTSGVAKIGTTALKGMTKLGAVLSFIDGGMNISEGITREDWKLSLSGALDVGSGIATLVWASPAGQAAGAILAAAAAIVKPDLATASYLDTINYLNNYSFSWGISEFVAKTGLFEEMKELMEKAKDANLPGKFFCKSTFEKTEFENELKRLEIKGLNNLIVVLEMDRNWVPKTQ